jgi:hypothetical protein
MKFRAFFPAVIAATCILAPSAAQAFTFQIGPNSTSSNGEPTGASARLNFDFTQSGDGVQLNLGIFNTTGELEPFGGEASTATLMGIAFDFASSVAFASLAYNPLESNFTNLYRDLNVQPFSSRDSDRVGSFDVGIGLSTPGNSGGGDNPLQGGRPRDGLREGQQTEVRFSFSPSTAGTSLSASDFAQAFEQEIRSGNLNVAARFQEVNGRDSDTLFGGRVTNSDRPTRVPEPAAVGALGLTAAGLGLLKKKQSAEAGDQDASA